MVCMAALIRVHNLRGARQFNGRRMKNERIKTNRTRKFRSAPHTPSAVVFAIFYEHLRVPSSVPISNSARNPNLNLNDQLNHNHGTTVTKTKYENTQIQTFLESASPLVVDLLHRFDRFDLPEQNHQSSLLFTST